MKDYSRIRVLREDAALTQKQVAEKLLMHLTQYRRYECGESEVPLHIAISIARLYNVSLDYIAGICDDKRGLTRSALTDGETKLVKSYRNLDRIAQGRLLERAEALQETRYKA